jgi:hypothetical protein
VNKKFLGVGAIFFGLSLTVPGIATLLMGERFVNTICRRECSTYHALRMTVGDVAANVMLSAIWMLLSAAFVTHGIKMFREKAAETPFQ